MADLSPFADRMEDTEIGANKPLTQTLFNKFGQNINFLLDFLGVTDGATSPSGTLSDLVQAVALCEGHTMDQQLNIIANGTFSIGTYTQPKFVNQVFYFYADGGQVSDVSFNWHKETGTGGSPDFYPLYNVDSGGNQPLNAGYSSTRSEYTNAFPTFGDTQNERFTKILNDGFVGTATDAGIGTPPQVNLLVPIIELDYRDPGTNHELLIKVQDTFGIGTGATAQIYREYKLNVGSAGF